MEQSETLLENKKKKEEHTDSESVNTEHDDVNQIHRFKDIRLVKQKEMDNLNFLVYLKSFAQLDIQIYEIERIWDQQNIPLFYSDTFISSLKVYDIQEISKRVTQQIELLKSRKSQFHKITSSIEIREICLKKINELLETLDRGNILKLFKKKYIRNKQDHRIYQENTEQGFKYIPTSVQIDQALDMIKSLFTDIFQLREITIYIINLIHTWKHHIENAYDQCHIREFVYYFINNQNFYQKIRTDNQFIWESCLSEYIYFDSLIDIFIIRNVLELEKKQEKELLESYFLEIVYPKEPQVFDRAIQAMQLLTYERNFPQNNEYEIEQLLIQNYLKLQNSPAKLQQRRLQEQKRKEEELLLKQSLKKEKGIKSRFKYSSRLSVADMLKKKQNILKQKQSQNMIPFNNVNFPTNLAAEYNIKLLQQQQKAQQRNEDPKKLLKVLEQVQQSQQKIIQEDGGIILNNNNVTNSNNNNIISSNQKKFRKSHSQIQNVYKSSLKLQSPRKKVSLIKHPPQNYQLQNEIKKNMSLESKKKEHSHTRSKENRSLDLEKQQLRIEQDYTPINHKLFEPNTHRPSTTLNLKKPKQIFKTPYNPRVKTASKKQPIKIQNNIEKLNALIKQEALQNKFKIRKQKEWKLKLNELPEKSYDQYYEIKGLTSSKRTKDLEMLLEIPTNTEDNQNMFLTLPMTIETIKDFPTIKEKLKPEQLFLKPKTIPFEILDTYLTYIFQMRNPILQIFTDYNQENLKQLLTSTQKVLIFEILNSESDRLGEIITIESVSKIGLIKYTIQFIHVQKFEYLVRSIFLFSQEIFRITPAEQIVAKFKLDKNDPISLQFIKIIDLEFSTKGKILQRKKMEYLNSEKFERLYLMRRDLDMRIDIIKYTHDPKLTIKANAFLFTSNFKLRKLSYLNKTYRQTNKEIKVNISLLYSHILQKIMTKHHMKVFKKVPDYIQQIIILLYKIKKEPAYDEIKVNEFTSTVDLKNYLEYKQYDRQQMLIDILEDSKFVLRKQLFLSQFNVEVKLDFLLKETVCKINDINYFYLILQNYRRVAVEAIKSTEFQPTLYLLPTTSSYKILILQAEQYLEFNTDLNTYLLTFLKTEKSRESLPIENICLPEAIFRSKLTESYLLSQQFPEREFYYSASLDVKNKHFYRNGIIREPKGLIFKYPLILGFFNKGLEVCYLLRQKNMIQQFY